MKYGLTKRQTQNFKQRQFPSYVPYNKLRNGFPAAAQTLPSRQQHIATSISDAFGEAEREVHRSWQDSVARISLRLRDWPRRSHPLLENKGQLSELGTLTWIFSWERKAFTVPLQLKAHLMYRRRSLVHFNWQIDGSLDMETRSSRGGSI